MKKSFQITLGIVGVIPLALGLLQLINGAAMFLPVGHVGPNIDSQIRFGSIWFMAAAFISWWLIPRVDQRQYSPIFRIMFLTMAGAGVARLVSMYLVGAPDPQVFGAIMLEISLVLLIPWQSMVVKKAEKLSNQPI